MNVLFNLLVINNFQNQEIGLEAVTGNRWVRLYFVLFHIFGVVLVNNLVIAFIINAFFQQLATVNSRKQVVNIEGEATIRGEQASFDASSITGTKTGASGQYFARIRAVHKDIELDEREELQQLFTRNSSEDL